MDVMAHGDALMAIGFTGEQLSLSGSSYATARVSALAACLLAADPTRSTPMLKRLIFARADAAIGTDYVAHGFISNLAIYGQGACMDQPPTSGI